MSRPFAAVVLSRRCFYPSSSSSSLLPFPIMTRTTAAAAAAAAASLWLLNNNGCSTTTTAFQPHYGITTGRRQLLHSSLTINSNNNNNNNNHHHAKMRYSTTRTSLLAASETQVEMTHDALEIVKQAIHAVDPAIAVQRHFSVNDSDELQLIATDKTSTSSFNSDDYDDIIIISFGKASSAMAAACVTQLGQSTSWKGLPIAGVVLCKDDHGTDQELDILQKAGGEIKVQHASHPVPDERSVQGARDIMTLVQDANNNRTLVVCCISGGGSALFCHPRPPLTLQDLQDTNQALLSSGLGITDMNVIRKRLELGKGGQLAAAVYPATLITLVLSDVLGDPLDLIASGPTVPDESTPLDAWQLIQSNPVLQAQLPQSVLTVIQEQVASATTDTTTPNNNHDDDDKIFEKAKTVLVGNNELAVLAAAEEAKKRGYNPIVLSTCLEGEARHVAGVYTAMAQYIVGQQHQQQQAGTTTTQNKYSMVQPPAALIAGGETTVTIPSDCHGKGGRNQELALAAALQLSNLKLQNVVVASIGTDGTDGPTDAAGAVVHAGTVVDTAAAEEALAQHDAYPYFAKLNHDDNSLGPLIMTGPTGTNVADVCVTLIR